MLTVASPTVEGHVSPGFEAVREAFAENFARRRSWAAPAVPITAARRSSISGAASATSRPASPGSRTPWWSSTRRRRVWPP